MALTTWNVNSLKMRLRRVLEFLAQHAPDVVCVQETRCEAVAFPVAELAQAGYTPSTTRRALGGGRDIELADAVVGLPGELREDEARWIEATVGGLRVVSVYVPNGRAVGSPTFDETLAFLDAAAQRVAAPRPDGRPLVVVGDFNVAPTDLDVYDPAAFAGSTHVTPEERSRIEAILAAGDLVDVYRHLHPGEVQHTWWDYRQGHFHRGMGLRIDLLLASEALAQSLVACGIARGYRKGSKPSDHAPLVAELAPG